MICAYYDVAEKKCYSLREHNWRVARALQLLFNNQLEAMTPWNRVLRRAGLSTAEAGVAAALLHDLGKASKYYQEKLGEGYGFRYHEHVSAYTLLAAAKLLEKRGDRLSAATLLLAAGAVARHHAAMKGRHVLELTSSPWAVRSRATVKACSTIAEAVRGLRGAEPGEVTVLKALPLAARTAIEEALRKGPSYVLGSEPCSELSKLLIGPGDGSGIGWAIATLATRILGAGREEKRLLARAASAAIYTVTGALIVADILVAGLERRREDDPAPLYAKSWAQELDGQAMAVLREILGEKQKS